MSKPGPRYRKDEFARRGGAIYETKIRPGLTKKHNGRFVAIDIETGAWPRSPPRRSWWRAIVWRASGGAGCASLADARGVSRYLFTPISVDMDMEGHHDPRHRHGT